MINLLKSSTSKQEILTVLNSGLESWLPAFDDPCWQKSIEHSELQPLRKLIIDRALDIADEPLPSLPVELYQEFARQGTRYGFEGPYFERRRRLGRTAFALMATQGKTRSILISSFCEKIKEIASESSWAVPAHVDDESGIDPFCIDLFSAETAYAMSEYITVFASLLDDAFVAAQKERIRQQFLENYLDHSDHFNWTQMTNNWNAVCHQGVLGAALNIETDPDRLAPLIAKVASNLPYFLQGFTPDGGCSEGPGYRSYGFGWFCRLNEQLEHQTGGRLSLIEGDEHVRRIARFAPAMSLSGGQSVNFADGGSGMASIYALDYIGKRLNDPLCSQLARENFERQFGRCNKTFNLDGLRYDFPHWWRLFSHVPDLVDSHELPPAQDTYLEDLAVWVVRGTDADNHLWELAAKAGNNEEHHNHNDVGSFLLHLDGIPFITEIGAPLYTKEFFIALTRYRNLAARSLGHSVPLINGLEQHHGESFQGKSIRATINQDPSFFEVDLSEAYPAEAGCLNALRLLTLNKRQGELLLEDRIELERAGTAESALITHSSEVLIVTGTTATIINGDIQLQLEAMGDGVWDRVEIHPYLNHGRQPVEIRRLVMKASCPSKVTNLSCRIFLNHEEQ
jgi:hypothetical protein